MHEIITLQLGQRSNYLATHFWNTQESYFTYSADEESIVDHDVHFRPGLGADGTETFTPRTLIYDLKGGFGSLKKINALYEIEEPGAPEALWNGPAVIQRQPAIPQNDYLKSLEDGMTPPPLTVDAVKYWSDFNRVYFHPKSIVQLNEYELNSSIMPFENWDSGEELFKSLDKEHDILDRDLRPFAEEADQMQGIQIMAGVDDSWGGFAARYIDRLRDEYGKTDIWFWGVEGETEISSRAKKILKLSNTARTTSEIVPQASLFVPLGVPASKKLPSYVTLDTRSHWHMSALLSTAIESMALSSRLKRKNRSLHRLDEIVNALNINGNQNIAKLRMSIENNIEAKGNSGTSKLDVPAQIRDVRLSSQERGLDESRPLDSDDLPVFDMDFFSENEIQTDRGRGNSKRTHVFGQFESYRVNKDFEDEIGDDEDAATMRARKRAAGLPLVHKSRIRLGFPILDSFPHIFSQAGPPQGSVSVHTSLSTDNIVALRIKGLRDVVNRSIGMEERETLSNSLGELAEAYEEGWDSGSDDDDD